MSGQDFDKLFDCLQECQESREKIDRLESKIFRLELDRDTHTWMIEKLQYRIHKFENMPIWKRLIVAIRGKLD